MSLIRNGAGLIAALVTIVVVAATNNGAAEENSQPQREVEALSKLPPSPTHNPASQAAKPSAASTPSIANDDGKLQQSHTATTDMMQHSHAGGSGEGMLGNFGDTGTDTAKKGSTSSSSDPDDGGDAIGRGDQQAAAAVTQGKTWLRYV